MFQHYTVILCAQHNLV